MELKCITGDGKEVTLTPCEFKTDDRLDILETGEIEIGPITYEGSMEFDINKMIEKIKQRHLLNAIRQQSREIFRDYLYENNPYIKMYGGTK